jgi:SAM-dependent methyltransferase
VRAARRTGCRGVGVELDPDLVDAARARARAAGVAGRIEFVHGDARVIDLGPATVVTLYLNAAANLTLLPHLRRGLRDGARVVSFDFDMGDWWADDVEVLDESAWGSNAIYLWTIRRRAARAA